MFVSEVSNLASAVAELMGEEDGVDAGVPRGTRDEWREFFADGVFSVLFGAFVDLASGASSAASSPAALDALGAALARIPDEQLFDHQLPAKFLVEDVDCDANFPEKLLFLLNHLCPLVAAAEAPAVQRTAFRLLLR